MMLISCYVWRVLAEANRLRKGTCEARENPAGISVRILGIPDDSPSILKYRITDPATVDGKRDVTGADHITSPRFNATQVPILGGGVVTLPIGGKAHKRLFHGIGGPRLVLIGGDEMTGDASLRSDRVRTTAQLE